MATIKNTGKKMIIWYKKFINWYNKLKVEDQELTTIASELEWLIKQGCDSFLSDPVITINEGITTIFIKNDWIASPETYVLCVCGKEITTLDNIIDNWFAGIIEYYCPECDNITRIDIKIEKEP